MGGSPQISRRVVCWSTILIVITASPAFGFTSLFFEDFDALSLQPPVQENSQIPNAFTHDAPPGWFRDVSDVPGVGTPSVGVFEWEGWSLANTDFWTEVAQTSSMPFTPRELFDLGQGTVAVADPDQWNDIGNPANTIGFFSTLLETPPIDLLPATGDDRLRLVFDSSWRGGCCDDGQNFDPGGNNQTAIINARVGNQRFEILRWESAPYFENGTGRPTTQPFDVLGFPNDANAFYRPDNFNERVVLDLSGFLPDPGGPGQAFAAAGEGAEEVVIEFEMEGAGDDGWWAFDSVEMVSYSTLLADMNLSGALDAGDFDAFALGMLDEEAYRFNYFGEFPESRGSLDSNFDFDDAAWFLTQMAGVSPSPALALAQALRGIPEPSTACLSALSLVGLVSLRRGASR